MTPQQKKADELVERFRNFEYKDSEDTVIHKNPYKATIQCAIICVDEVLEATKIEVDRPDAGCYTVYSQYWQSVLNELKSRL